MRLNFLHMLAAAASAAPAAAGQEPTPAMEIQILRDLPVISLGSLSYVIVRNPRIDLGYKVRSGYAYWPLKRARVMKA